MTRRPATRRTRVMSALPAALSLAAVLALPGCYRLAPLETDTPDQGSEVRLALTDAGSVQMASLVGPRVEALEGRTLEVSDSSVVLAVSSTFDRAGIERPWSNERVSVAAPAADTWYIGVHGYLRSTGVTIHGEYQNP